MKPNANFTTDDYFEYTYLVGAADLESLRPVCSDGCPATGATRERKLKELFL